MYFSWKYFDFFYYIVFLPKFGTVLSLLNCMKMQKSHCDIRNRNAPRGTRKLLVVTNFLKLSPITLYLTFLSNAYYGKSGTITGEAYWTKML